MSTTPATSDAISTYEAVWTLLDELTVGQAGHRRSMQKSRGKRPITGV